MKRFLSCLLAVMIGCGLILECSTLSGCNSVKAVAMGRYVEKKSMLPEIDTDSRYIGIQYSKDGNLEILVDSGTDANQKIYAYESNGEGFTKREITGLQKYFDQGFTPYKQRCVYGTDGKWYLYMNIRAHESRTGEILTDEDIVGDDRDYTPEEYNKINEKTQGYELSIQVKILRENEDITPDSVIGKNYTINDDEPNEIQVCDNGIIVYRTYHVEYHAYDPTTKEDRIITKLSDIENRYNPWKVKGNSLYLISNYSSAEVLKSTSLFKYDATTGEQQDSYDIDPKLLDDTCQMDIGEDDTLYFVNDSGLYKHKKNGSVWEELIVGSDCTFTSPEADKTNLLYCDHNDEIGIIINEEKWNKTECLIYSYDSTVPTNADKTLTIYSLWDCPTLRQATLMYRTEHPDVNIEYKVGMENMDDPTQQIQNLNTMILTGSGSDLILTDGLNRAGYEKKGILEDLSSTIDISNLMNVVEKDYKNDNGKLYAVPLKITLPSICSQMDMSGKTGTIDDLESFCKDNPDFNFYRTTPQMLIRCLLYAYGDGVFEKDGSINKDNVTNFLSKTKNMSDQNLIRLDYNINPYKKRCCAQMIYLWYAGDYVYMDSNANKAMFTANTSIADLCMMNGLGVKYPSYMQNMGNKYFSSGTLSINANSKNKQIAKDFMSFLYSDEIQTLDCGDGYPVTKSAQQNWREKYQCGRQKQFFYDGKDGSVFTYYDEEPNESNRKQAIDNLQSVTGSVYQNAEVVQMLMSESEEYLNDSKTLDETVNNIMEKVNRYIQEQK